MGLGKPTKAKKEKRKELTDAERAKIREDVRRRSQIIDPSTGKKRLGRGTSSRGLGKRYDPLTASEGTSTSQATKSGRKISVPVTNAPRKQIVSTIKEFNRVARKVNKKHGRGKNLKERAFAARHGNQTLAIHVVESENKGIVKMSGVLKSDSGVQWKGAAKASAL